MNLPIHLLSEHFVKTRKISHNTPFEIFEIDAVELLCPQRLDLAAKIAYIESRENNSESSFALELYKKHIEAFSEGYYAEPGDKEKQSFGDYVRVFNSLIENIKNYGFDSSRSLIPIGEDNIILDGAHRTACAIYFKRKVSVIKFKNFRFNFDYSFFKRRFLSQEMLDYMAIEYCVYSQRHLYCACFWPVSDTKNRKQALSLIQNHFPIVCEKEVVLNERGLRNFILQIYQHQNWIGTFENHFAGVMGKVKPCFCPGKKLHTILFEAPSLDCVVSVKSEIRKILCLDKDSIHISDTNDESFLMSTLLMNENSIHALNYGLPDCYPAFFVWLRKNVFEHCCLDIYSTLSFYGICNFHEKMASNSLFDAYNPRQFLMYGLLKLPSLEIILEHSKRESPYFKVLKKISKAGRKEKTCFRKIDDLKTHFYWALQKKELRLKQITMKVTKRFGIYEFLHKLHHIKK